MIEFNMGGLRVTVQRCNKGTEGLHNCLPLLTFIQKLNKSRSFTEFQYSQLGLCILIKCGSSVELMP